jgi:metal-sulfur cluster biosynthetic enzyme
MVQDISIDLPAGVDRRAILERLSSVLDPELDEPLLALGFIQSLQLRESVATLELLLPTSWCAINFVFIMAEDVRNALLGVAGIQQVAVRVGDHASAREIEAAVNSGKPFAAAFHGEGAESLSALRAVFLRKGFAIRQERLLRELRATGLDDRAIGALRIADRSAMMTEALRRYLERRAELSIDCSPQAPLIVDQNGASVPEEALEAHYQRIRTVRVALEANGSFCRANLAARSQQVQLENTKQGGADV